MQLSGAIVGNLSVFTIDIVILILIYKLSRTYDIETESQNESRDLQGATLNIKSSESLYAMLRDNQDKRQMESFEKNRHDIQ